MEINNSLAEKKKTGTFSQFLGSDGVKNSLANALGNPKSVERFTSSILSAVSVNPGLQKCDFSTVVSSGLLANALNLSLSPSLGFAYIVPFNDRKNSRTVATFILGYRGYIQLAIRSGYYAQINVIDVREGELIKRDDLREEYVIKQIEDYEARKKTPVIGYLATFSYINGFRKTIYRTKSEMIDHADTYVPSFSKEATTGRYPKVSFADYEAGNYKKEDEWLYSSFWYRGFDAMARKTMIRDILSHWGIMSIDMQTAYEADIENERRYEEGLADVSFSVEQSDVEAEIFSGTEESAEEIQTTPKKGKKDAAKSVKQVEESSIADDGADLFHEAENLFGDPAI